MAAEPSSVTTWQADTQLSHYPKLERDITVDVVIVGGGITGLLSAYALAQAGKSVAVLETNRLASGATAYTTAFVTQYIDTAVSDLIATYGKSKAKQTWDSHGEAINYIEKIVREEQIACDFMRCSLWPFATDAKQRDELWGELSAMQQLGIKVRWAGSANLGFKHRGALQIPGQAKFHPLKFIKGLLAVLERKSVQIFELTPATDMVGEGPVIVSADAHTVTADTVILATYDPRQMRSELFMKKGMYVSYVFEALIPRGKLREGTYQDMASPYHYFRVDHVGAQDRLIIGGEDNRQELAFHEQKNFNALHDYLQALVGEGQYAITRKWSGPILEPSDGLALIGEVKPHQFVAAAFSGNGMTYASITAQMARDYVLGRENAWASIYDPTRGLAPKALLHKSLDYAQELIGATIANTLFHWRRQAQH